MFWDGTRWVTPTTEPKPSARGRSRLRDILATGIMALALVGLVVPTVATSAATPPPANDQLREWRAGYSVKTYSEASDRITYKGTWRRADHPGHMGGHVRFSNQANATATITVTGTAVSIIGPVGPTRGQMKIYLDGQYVRTVNTYASRFQPARTLWTKEFASSGTHKFVFRVVGTKGHPTFALDSVVVRGAPTGPTDNTTASAKVGLSPDKGPAGTRTTLSFTGFPKNASGAIQFAGSTAGMPSYTTDGSGRASVAVTIPTSASVGNHKLEILATTGERLVERTFTVSDASDPTPTPTPAPPATSAPSAAPTTAPDAAPGVTPKPTAAPTPLPTATPKPTAVPTATPPPSTSTSGYDAVFSGDATGATDVTAQLKQFLQSNNGKRVALAVNGVYKVTQLSFTASDLTIDFRGARIQGSKVGASGIFRIQTSSNIVVNDPKVFGTGYRWEGEGTNNQDPNQNEHGIQVDGGRNITINRPVIRDTRGDGIYTSHQVGKNQPPVNVVINQPDIVRSSRNGIAPVSGEVTIRGGRISQSGLHGIDFEVNNDAAANSIVGVVDGVDIRRHGDIPGIERTSYAVAAGGYSTATKPSMLVQNLTGDKLNMTIRNTASVIVRNNVSDTSTSANFPGCTSVSFSGNTRISRQ